MCISLSGEDGDDEEFNEDDEDEDSDNGSDFDKEKERQKKTKKKKGPAQLSPSKVGIKPRTSVTGLSYESLVNSS